MGVESMVGCVLTNIMITEADDEIVFIADLDSRRWKMHHEQDCCENVTIKDICGDLQDLIGTELLLAEERVSRCEEQFEPEDSSYTWTFYEFRTAKGSVTISWYGSSNGYYSESVTFGEQRYN